MTVPGTIDHRFVQDVKKGIKFYGEFPDEFTVFFVKHKSCK